MLIRLFFLIVASTCFACSDAQSPEQNAVENANPELALQRIDSLERLVFPQGVQAGTDTTRGWPYVRAVQNFAEANVEHPRTPELLMKAAGIANGTNWSNKSIQLWGYVWRRYPDSPRAPEAMFYQGFVMDSKFSDYNLAKQYYKRFLKTFPEHELVPQVEGLLAVIENNGKVPPVPGSAPN
jgi:hypothetical protein